MEVKILWRLTSARQTHEFMLNVHEFVVIIIEVLHK